MSDTKPLLVINYLGKLSAEQMDRMRPWADKIQEISGMPTLLCDEKIDVQVQHDLLPLVEALDRYTASVAIHTHAVRQNSEILTGLVTMLLTEEDRQDPDDEPVVGASMNSPRGR